MNRQSFYRLFASCAVMAALSACDARPQSEMTGRSILDVFTEDGPELTGVSDTLYITAQEAEKNGNYGRAFTFYKQLIDKDPDNVNYQIGLAENSRRTGAVDDAIRLYTKILQKNPNNIRALEGKGLAHITKGDFAEANPLLERVMVTDGERWRALNGIGLLFVAKGLPNEALAYFDAALQQRPNDPALLNNLGLTHALNQNYPTAIVALRRASTFTQKETEKRQRADLNLALIYGLSGEMELAEEAASRHLSQDEVHNNMGFYAYLADNRPLAKAYLNDALSGSKTFYQKAWNNLEAVGGTNARRN